MASPKDERGRSMNIPFFRERFINEMGEADEILPIDEALVKKYEKIMPNELMYYWKTYGLTSFYNGLFWLTNPDDYKELVEQYLADTPLANREAYVIGRGAFGKLLIWEINKGETIWIQLFRNLIYLNATEDRHTLVGEHNEYQMNRTIGIIEPSDMDQDDASNKPLFERALKKFGKLKSNEMYGMKLHESLGGKQSIRNIDKVDLFVYADIQLELEKPHFVVMDTEAMFS